MNIFGKKINNAEEAKALYAKAKELDAAGKFYAALVAYKGHENHPMILAMLMEN